LTGSDEKQIKTPAQRRVFNGGNQLDATTQSSLPGLTRQSINFLKRQMDARVKPGHDDCEN
jgi:hypothetical protein